ncbi:MAG: protein kinase [Proteobacteria bacterium]|nr:protein kinase [Pseudomonadota bacterium]
MSDCTVGSALEPPRAVDGQTIEWGPQRARNENRWGLLLPDGKRAVLGQLLPELAEVPALRRRYVYEIERLAHISAPCLAEILAWGPMPDPREAGALPPWRLRVAPPGRGLDDWLEARAPVPVDEALAVVADLADAVHQVHAAGAVLRDLEPRCVIVGEEGRIWLVDIGLARLDILSSRTASSLMLESSPYAAPEHLRATVVDLRADLFTLGVILWQALTGTLPFGDRAGILRDYDRLPILARLRPEITRSASADGVGAGPDEIGETSALDHLLRRCLVENPALRLSSARELAELLRGRARSEQLQLARVPCQSCLQPMRPGLRLCLSCGKTAVMFEHVDAASEERYILYLNQASEHETFSYALREFFDQIAEKTPPLNFLVGDRRMYSNEERESLRALPAPLFTDLSADTAQKLARRLEERGLKVSVRRAHSDKKALRRGRQLVSGGIAGQIAGVALLVAGGPLLGLTLLGAGIAATVWGGIARRRAGGIGAVPMARLRSAPAALPASDPRVLRIARLLTMCRAPDVREQVSELALLVQRVSDYREQRGLASESEHLAAESLDAAIGLIEREVLAIVRIDDDLGKLDEGAIIRAIATGQARRDPAFIRTSLSGLDRLRILEDRRAAHLSRLLEASSLLRRAVDLELDDRDADQLNDNYLTMALAALGDQTGADNKGAE